MDKFNGLRRFLEVRSASHLLVLYDSPQSLVVLKRQTIFCVANNSVNLASSENRPIDVDRAGYIRRFINV